MIQPVSWAGSNCKGRASSRHVKEPFILRITGSETSAGSDHVTSAAVFFHHGCKRFKLIRCLSGYVRCTLLRNLKQLCIESPTGVFGYPCLGTLKPVRSTASGRESSGRDKCTPVLAAGKKPSAARESGSPFFRRRAPQQPETRHSFPRPRKTRWIQRIRRGPSHIADVDVLVAVVWNLLAGTGSGEYITVGRLSPRCPAQTAEPGKKPSVGCSTVPQLFLASVVGVIEGAAVIRSNHADVVAHEFPDRVFCFYHDVQVISSGG